jgi:hypothetical protein
MNIGQRKLTASCMTSRALRLRTCIQQHLLYADNCSGAERLISHYFTYWQQRTHSASLQMVWKQLASDTPWQDFHDIDDVERYR